MEHDEDIARWLEVAEARAWADQARAIAEMPGNSFKSGATEDRTGTAFWLGAVDVGFFNRSIGLGVATPATEAAVDGVIGAFRAAGLTQFVVQVSPFATPAMLDRWLVDRGLVPGRRWAKLWRTTEDIPTPRTDLRVERIGRDHEAAFASIVLAAFEMPEFLTPIAAATIDRPGWSHYLTFDGHEAVGAAAMYISDDVAWLGFGSTLESHRGRGSQGALFSQRLRDAASLGARLAITETGEDSPESPNPSYRNMLRAGFHFAYLRRNWVPAVAT